MPLLEPTSVVALAVLAVVIVLACAIVSIPFVWYYLWHRRRTLEIKGTHTQQVDTLHERMEKLEKKCTAMQEQITDAHMLLVDERRQLDKKLSETFPEIIAPIPDEPETPKARRNKRERA